MPDSLKQLPDLEDLYKLTNPAEDIEVPQSLQDRWQTVARVTWTSGQSVGSMIWNTTDIRGALFHTTTNAIYANNPLVRFVNGFAKMRCDWEIRLTIQGTMNAYGSLMFAVNADSDQTVTGHFEGMHADPWKVFLFANDPGSTVVNVPFKSPYYVNIEQDAKSRYSWGNMTLWVNAPLRNASTGTPPSATILIEARPRRLRVKFPTNRVVYQSAPALAEAKKVASGNQLSAGAKSLGKVAIKSVAGAINPLLPAALDLLPFDRPIDASNPQRSVIVDSDILCNVTGSTVSRRVGLAPVQPMPSVGRPDGVDYRQYKNYGKIWSRVGALDVATATAVDEVLGQFMIAPWVCPNTSPTGFYDFGVGPLQWLARWHSFWRGGIKYQVQIHVPDSANFQLRISIADRALTTVPSADSGNIYNMIVDVKGNTVVEFTVPYLADNIYSPVPYNFIASQFTSDSVLPVASGLLTFSKVTQPLSPYSQAVIPYIVVLACAADDLTFAGPIEPHNQSGWTYQSAESSISSTVTKPLFPAQTVVEDCASYPEKIDNWVDFWKTPFSTGAYSATFGVQIPNSLRYTFRWWRGSQRHVVDIVTDTELRRQPPMWINTGRKGMIAGELKAGKIHSIELPWSCVQPWAFTSQAPENYNLDRWVTSTALPDHYASMCDDLDCYFPTMLPTVRIPQTDF